MREEREEGGTQGLLGDIKLGLVVLLKQSFGEGNLFLWLDYSFPDCYYNSIIYNSANVQWSFFMAFLLHYAVFSHDFFDLNSMKVVSILPTLRILLLLVTLDRKSVV